MARVKAAVEPELYLYGYLVRRMYKVINWGRGGWFGSLRRYVAREVREHIKENPAIRRARYPLSLRFLRWLLSEKAVGWFVIAYLGLNAMAALSEILLGLYASGWPKSWELSNDHRAFLKDSTSYLISAQVGILAIISLAVGLIALVTERSSKELLVYYHETLTFEFFASSVALLSVLCIQVFWPLQTVAHRIGFGTNTAIFKFFLSSVHITWLLINLAALAHFVADSLRFVQQDARARIRERYTANVVLPYDLTQSLLRAFYAAAPRDFVPAINEHNGPLIFLGYETSSSYPEVSTDFARPVTLCDVRMRPLGWVLKRWWQRCELQSSEKPGRRRPVLAFSPSFDRTLEGVTDWCVREGGVPLTKFEKFLLRRSFRFRRVRQ